MSRRNSPVKALANDNDDDETTVATKAMEATAAELIFMLPGEERMRELMPVSGPAESARVWYKSKFRGEIRLGYM